VIRLRRTFLVSNKAKQSQKEVHSEKMFFIAGKILTDTFTGTMANAGAIKL
jgi:hypothetical protein